MDLNFFSTLLPPANYFSLQRGRFTVTPGFVPLTTSFGNGVMDARLFQIDQEFPRFRANKQATIQENRDKYVCTTKAFAPLLPEVCRLMILRLVIEYPEYFVLIPESRGAGTLTCKLTGERFRFDSQMQLMSVERGTSEKQKYIAYSSMWEAILAQVPEDIAVVSLPEGQPDANVALYVTAPSHWIPHEKIGTSFLETHAPVPNFSRIANAAPALLETVRTRPPVVRFNWGIEFTDRLNLHPEPPPDAIGDEWNRRRLRRTDTCPIYLRLERQVLWGMETARAMLFSIRVYIRPITTLSMEERELVRQTLISMPEDSRIYKGLPPDTFAETIDYLASI